MCSTKKHFETTESRLSRWWITVCVPIKCDYICFAIIKIESNIDSKNPDLQNEVSWRTQTHRTHTYIFIYVCVCLHPGDISGLLRQFITCSLADRTCCDAFLFVRHRDALTFQHNGANNACCLFTVYGAAVRTDIMTWTSSCCFFDGECLTFIVWINRTEHDNVRLK